MESTTFKQQSHRGWFIGRVGVDGAGFRVIRSWRRFRWWSPSDLAVLIRDEWRRKRMF